MIIYKITNLINNMIYIGQTNWKYKSYFGGGVALRKAISEYKKENFKFEILVEGDFNKELLNDLEKHYIRLYNSNNSIIGYNLTIGGSGVKKRTLTKEEISNWLRKRDLVEKIMLEEYNKTKPEEKLEEITKEKWNSYPKDKKDIEKELFNIDVLAIIA